MARKNRIKELEAEKGDLSLVIPPLANSFGQKGAAVRLKTTQATISRWLKDNDYVARTWWEKDTTPQEKASIQRVADRVNEWRAANGLPSLEEEAAS